MMGILNRGYRVPVVTGVLLVVASLIVACMPVRPIPEVNAQPALADNVEDQVNAVWSEYVDAIKTGDVERWVALWAEGAMQLPPGELPVEGVENLRAMRTAGAGMFDFDMEINNLEAGHGPEYAFARGFYSAEVTPKAGGEPSFIDGKYLTILQQQPDGRWKLYRDCYNSNVPPAAPAEPDVEAVTAEINALFDEYGASLEAGDAERWIQLWTEDGVQSPPGAPPNVGRDAIFASNSADLEQFAYEDMRIDVEEVLVAGDLAIARGMFTVTAVPKDGSAPAFVDGKYTSTFQRQPDGSWKLHRDIYNSNVP